MDKQWHAKGLKPLIEPIKDVEWVHVLFLHPREAPYNKSQTEFHYAPTLLEKTTLLALRTLQIEYTRFLLMTKASDMYTFDQLDKLRDAFRELDCYTQNWILQLLVGSPKAPKAQKLRGSILVRGNDSKNIKKLKNENEEVKNYITEVRNWWYKYEAGEQQFDLFPHEISNIHPVHGCHFPCRDRWQRKTLLVITVETFSNMLISD